jgi:hypothetical protein
MTDETKPTPGQPMPPAQPGPQPPAAVLPPAAVPPPPPAEYGQAAPSGSALPTPPKKKNAGPRIVRIVATVVVVLIVGLIYRSYQNNHTTASAPNKGACVQTTDGPNDRVTVAKVDCSDTKADYVVLDKIAGGSDTACDTVAGTEKVLVLPRGDSNLYVLCLKSK